ncbi:hypothetical protein CPB86DRAFT_875747, partial [Serendipita vermifera]
MTQLSSSSEDISASNPQEIPPEKHTEPLPKPPPNSAPRVAQGSKARRANKPGGQWCKAAFYTIVIVIVAYFWLSWTDPDQIALRQHAWDAAMERIRGKQVVHANRYSNEFRFRPAASPIITETLPDGRTKLRGARHGDHIPIPTPTP